MRARVPSRNTMARSNDRKRSRASLTASAISRCRAGRPAGVPEVEGVEGSPTMTIEQVMTRDVITVNPAASIHTAARLMGDHGISGLPVVADDGKLVGIISEGDLILRHTRRAQRPWWRAFFEDPEQVAREYRKAAGTTVAEVMSHPVVSISPVDRKSVV